MTKLERDMADLLNTLLYKDHKGDYYPALMEDTEVDVPANVATIMAEADAMVQL